jgi:hypothetical protein
MVVRTVPSPTSWSHGSTLLPLFKDQLLVDCIEQSAIAERLGDQLKQVSMGSLYTGRTRRTLICMADTFWTISELMHDCEAGVRQESSPSSSRRVRSFNRNAIDNRLANISLQSS